MCIYIILLCQKIMTILYQISVYKSNKINYDVNEVINESIDVDEKYKGIKKVMEEAPNGVDVKPMSKFRKDTRIEKY